MEPLELINLAVGGIYLAFIVVITAYLVARAVKLRNVSVWVLAFSFAMLALPILMNDVFGLREPVLRAVCAVNYPVGLVIFTKLAFYRKKRSMFRVILPVAIGLRVVHFIEMVAHGYTVPSYEALLPSDLPLYYLHVFLVSIQLAIAFAWLAMASYHSYTQTRSESIEPWIWKRFLLVSAGNMIYIFIAFVFFLFPTDGSVYASLQSYVASILAMAGIAGYGIISLVTIWTPDWVKRVLNGKFDRSAQDTDFDKIKADAGKAGGVARALTRRELIDAIDFLGNKLAVLIDRSPAAAKGLLLLSLEKEFGEIGLFVLNFDSLMHLMDNKFKVTLATLGIQDCEAISTIMKETIIANQSLFLMMSL